MRLTSLGLALLLPFAAMAASAPSVELDRHVTGRIVIAPDGHVQDLALDPSGLPDVDRAVDAAVRKWTFQPVVVDGRAVVAETRMTVGLTLVPVADGYRLRIGNTSFGSPERSGRTMRPPQYPRDALMAGLGAKVMLVLRLDASGAVAQVHAEQVSLDKRTPTENVAERWRRVFERTSVVAAQQWRFDGLERIDGKVVETTVRIPVEYIVGGPDPSKAQRWHAVVPGPYRPAPWVSDESVAQDTLDALHEGDIQSLDTRVRLKTDVKEMLL